MECDKGIRVGDLKIPGLFFADDIVLMAESQKELQEMLNIAGEYGNKWRLEFSKDKSKVMTLGKKPDGNKKWRIGQFQIPEGREQLIEIGEVDEYEYLGVKIKTTGKGMFRYQVEKIKQKVNRTKGMIKATALNSFNRAYTARVLWDRVAIPGMIYGLDVISVSEGDIQGMEKAQNEMGKWILGAPPCTATEAVLGELGWNKITDRIAKAKLKYWGYLQGISEDRWCRKVYNQVAKEKTRWVKDIDGLAEKYELKGYDEVDDWKVYVGKTVTEGWKEDWKRGVREKSTLKAYKVLEKPQKSVCWDGGKGSKLLFQSRAGVINLEKRSQKWTTGSNGKCKSCRKEADETVDHWLLWCDAYREIREDFFRKWHREDYNYKGLEEVQGLEEEERIAWILGMKGGFLGGRKGNKNVQDYLVGCWEKRNEIIELEGNRLN